MAVVAFLFNGFNAIKQLVPAPWALIIDGVLVVLISYFKLNPSQGYGKGQQQ